MATVLPTNLVFSSYHKDLADPLRDITNAQRRVRTVWNHVRPVVEGKRFFSMPDDNSLEPRIHFQRFVGLFDRLQGGDDPIWGYLRDNKNCTFTAKLSGFDPELIAEALDCIVQVTADCGYKSLTLKAGAKSPYAAGIIESHPLTQEHSPLQWYINLMLYRALDKKPYILREPRNAHILALPTIKQP
jgi:hypothetical protein